MNISIFRNYTNSLYTEGELYINGKLQSHTLEATPNMLPAGTYTLQFVKKSQHKKALVAHRKGKPTGIAIGAGYSFHAARKQNLIIIGTRHMHGAMIHSHSVCNRLSDRIEKAINSHRPVFLTIHDKHVIHDLPISWWSQMPNHGCPPTRQTVDVETIDANTDHCTIHCNDGTVKNFTITYPNS